MKDVLQGRLQATGLATGLAGLRVAIKTREV